MQSQEWNGRGIQKTLIFLCSWDLLLFLGFRPIQVGMWFLKSFCLIQSKTKWQYYCFVMLWAIYITLLNGSIGVLILRKRWVSDLTTSIHQVHVRFKIRCDRHLVKTQMSEVWIHDLGLQSSALSVRLVCLQQLHVTLQMSCPVSVWAFKLGLPAFCSNTLEFLRTPRVMPFAICK